MSCIKHYLKSCRELTHLCSLNGCIDTDSLRYTVIIESGHELVVAVEFDEWLLEGTANSGSRVACRGQLHLFLDRLGRISHAEVL